MTRTERRTGLAWFRGRGLAAAGGALACLLIFGTGLPAPAPGTEPLPASGPVSAPDPLSAPVPESTRPDHVPEPPPPVPARLGTWSEREAFTDPHAPFAVRVGDTWIPYRLMAVSAMPGEVLEIRVDGAAEPGRLALRTDRGAIEEASPGRWEWEAPTEPGIRALRIEAASVPSSGVAGLDEPHESIHLNVLVLHPRSSKADERLGGYRIGRYRDPGPGGNPLHEPPRGFVEVGPEAEDVLVSPHFTLGQFVSHQPGDPRYIAYSESLILKLEAILEAVNEAGFPAPTLHVMSAFRTPHYNRAIGNTTDFSRHLWGDAADIFIDTTGDGMMDDLNGDGRVDDADARILYRIVETVEQGGEPHIHEGGLGLYPANAVRGPFVHVDARGYRARW